MEVASSSDTKGKENGKRLQSTETARWPQCQAGHTLAGQLQVPALW